MNYYCAILQEALVFIRGAFVQYLSAKNLSKQKINVIIYTYTFNISKNNKVEQNNITTTIFLNVSYHETI